MRISEIFVSVQGEGPSIGRPALFLRLSYCNLRCVWCDTKYSWYEGIEKSVSNIFEEVLEYLRSYPKVRLLVVTGGEPLLQKEELLELLWRLKKEVPDLEVEVETNCTADPSELVELVNRLIVSPKLSNSGVPAELRKCSEGIRAASTRYPQKVYLKFVIQSTEDLSEVEELVANLGVSTRSVFLMPQASTKKELEERLRVAVDLALRTGYRVSDRLQIVGGFR